MSVTTVPMRKFLNDPADVVRESLAGLAAAHGDLVRHDAEAQILVPMAFERRLVGFLALGQKQSGRFYSGEDSELLRTLANQGAVAVENAHEGLKARADWVCPSAEEEDGEGVALAPPRPAV